MLALSNIFIDTATRSIRCGVVPYTFKNDSLYFLLGRDRATGELGDFGGGIKKDEKMLAGGLREFIQETKGVFGEKYNTAEHLTNKLALVTKQMSIIFVPVSPEWIDKAPRLFQARVSTDKQSNEMEELVWLDERSLKYHITNRSSRLLWKKVKTFFQDNYIPKNDLKVWLRNVYTTSQSVV